MVAEEVPPEEPGPGAGATPEPVTDATVVPVRVGGVSLFAAPRAGTEPSAASTGDARAVGPIAGSLLPDPGRDPAPDPAPARPEGPLGPLTRAPDGVGWWLAAALAGAALSGFGVRHVASRQQLETARRYATRDPLTGLANRRLFEESLEREIARQRRRSTPLALALVDLDGFKRVNDSRGHAAGDAVLRAVADVVVGRVRGSDVAARYGGDEFAILLPECSVDDACRVADALRGAIADAVGPGVTASVGVAVVPDHAADGTGLVLAADAALYEAKERGRNRVVLAEGVPAGGGAPGGA